jgi:hypothetical protein
MEKNYSASPIRELLSLSRTILISILGGALTGILAAVIGSTFNIKH